MGKIKKYMNIFKFVIFISSIITISGVLGDSYLPYIIVTIMFWIYVIIDFYINSKSKN